MDGVDGVDAVDAVDAGEAGGWHWLRLRRARWDKGVRQERNIGRAMRLFFAMLSNKIHFLALINCN
jgi:hypothetical protein